MTSAASSSSRDLTVLTASDVDTVLAKMDLSLAVAGQAQVFAAYSNKDKKDEGGLAGFGVGAPPLTMLII
jgi:hypothetical protein